MRLSVIIACLNGADTIGAQLDALAANQQWSEPWEVIFADNGSTDGTVTIVEQYRHKLPKLLIVDASDQPGKAYACNVAMLAASGNAVVHYRHRNTLAASYRQARNWSDSYVILRKKYGGSLSRLMMLKLLIGGWGHMPLCLLRIRS